MRATVMRRMPNPIVVVEHELPLSPHDDDDLVQAVHQQLGPSAATLRSAGCRAVSLDRLEYVLECGVDVAPTTAVIFLDFLSKALEYGGDEKLILSFDQTHLECTFREVPANSSEEELERLSERYPTRLTSEDGQMLWFSRLAATDRRITTPYEVAYARWIPGDPWAALRCLLIIGRIESDLIGKVERALTRSLRFAQEGSSAGAA